MENVYSEFFCTLKRRLERLAVLALVVVCPAAATAQTNSSTSAEAPYTRTINQRADKIVASLGIADANKDVHVRDIIAQQYHDLNTIHEVRDAQINAAKAKSHTDKSAATAAIQAAHDDVKPRLENLHAEFLARLSVELSPEQMDKVKDGMTYGVVHVTFNAYLKMYPELTGEQKQQIMRWLVEAREIAMDGSTSGEKHAVFGKYKGRINNYLSKEGYDAKKAELNLKKSESQASDPKPQ